MKLSLPVVAVTFLCLAACGTSTTTVGDCSCAPGEVCRPSDGQCVAQSSGTGGGTNGDSGGGSGSTQQGLPCDVAALVGTRCIACHAATPSSGAPNALVTRDDLLRKSPSGATYAARSLIRMKDAQVPMPPAFTLDSASPAEIALFEAWVNAGLPGGACTAATSGGSGGGTASGGGTGASGGGTGASGGGTASGGGPGATGGGAPNGGGTAGGGSGGTGGGGGSAYCRACTSDAACGGGNNFCIGFSFGDYCGVDCSTSACPANQRCVGITDGVSTLGRNCVPLTGATCVSGTGGGSGSGGTGGGSGAGGGSTSCTTDTWANYGKSFFANTCNSCHQHTGEFSSRTAVLNKKTNISNRINVGNMPPGGLSASATTRIMTYLNCGVP